MIFEKNDNMRRSIKNYFFFINYPKKKLCEGIRGVNLSLNSKIKRRRQLVSLQKKKNSKMGRNLERKGYNSETAEVKGITC